MRFSRPSLLLACLLLTACGEPVTVEPAPSSEAPVRVTEARRESPEAGLRTIGVVAPAEEIRLSFKMAGVIASIRVVQGEQVVRGQALAELDLQEIQAGLDQARALAQKAQRDLERGEALFADEVATREQVEDLRTASEVARAQLQAAEFNARLARIEAPADGVILRKLAEQDELVAAGHPVLVLGNTASGWIVKASLSDRERMQVALGDGARIELDALPGRVLRGEVVELASAADPLTGTFEARIAIAAPVEGLVQGLTAKVSLEPAAGGGLVTTIPVEALLEADGRTAQVFIVARREDATVAERVEVRIGRLVRDRIEVLGGLSGGEQVVTEGASWLRDGQPVRVLGSG
ncbi:MAG: efflux RND transporter periplasmic adaptor subunit [Steroidobacteraceae bacterium]